MLSFLLLVNSESKAQTYYTVRGYVYNEKNEALPYVNIRVRGQNYGTTTDELGRYTLKLEAGFYPIVYSFIGYETQVHNLNVDGDKVQNIWMKERSDEFNEVVITNKRRDVAWEVMQKASQSRNQHNYSFQSSECKVYIKATEVSDDMAKKEQKSKRFGKQKDSTQRKDTTPPARNMALVESQLTRYYQYPDKFKEVRDGYSRRGGTSGLFFTTTAEADINFYENLIYAPAISDNKILSPLNPIANLAYKFKLIESYYDNNRKIYHIRITPRKTGNALFEGEIWIQDSVWNIEAIDVTLDKSHMKEYDYFRLRQEYNLIKDSFRVITRQEFHYASKLGNDKIANGKTVAIYSDFKFNLQFESKFFGSELSITSKEALNRDTGYWNQIRPEPLSIEEQKFAARLDSIKEARSQKVYLDSIDSIFNRVTAQKLLWLGQGHINRGKEIEINFAPAINMFNPVMVGGPRVQYWTSFFKRFKDRRYIIIVPNASYGIRNNDLQGSFYSSALYNPFKRSVVSFNFGRNFDLINPYDAYINLFRRSNFYLNDHFSLNHSTELINGLYLHTGLDFEDRKSLKDYKFGTTADRIFNNNTVISFSPYRAITTDISISYTPKQQYLRMPLEKVILGSKWPTFGLSWSKGYAGFLNSPLDFDYLSASIKQDVTIGVFGTSSYSFMTGKFLNTKNVPYIDYKFMRRGDPYLFTNPLGTFQLLDTTFATFDWFFEGHYIHHFQGFLINRIPYMVKTGIKETAGASFMYCVDQNYQHVELFFGFERVIRIINDRWRLGIYYAIAESNKYKPSHGLKFSLEYYDKRLNRWNF